MNNFRTVVQLMFNPDQSKEKKKRNTENCTYQKGRSTNTKIIKQFPHTHT